MGNKFKKYDIVYHRIDGFIGIIINDNPVEYKRHNALYLVKHVCNNTINTRLEEYMSLCTLKYALSIIKTKYKT